MAMKYIWLSRVYFPSIAARHKPKWATPFKWEWRLEWEEQERYDSVFDYPWVSKHLVLPNRHRLREWKRYVLDARWCRNVVVKRRLVQANWETYNDSFRHNAGRGLA
jgi:hypothetical protein